MLLVTSGLTRRWVSSSRKIFRDSGGSEVAAFLAPAHDRIDHACDQLPHGRLALRRVGLTVEIFQNYDVRSGLATRIFGTSMFSWRKIT